MKLLFPFDPAHGSYAEMLEAVPHSNLYLPGIAKPTANRPVKIEQQRCRRWVAEVVAIQNVEYLNQCLELASPTQTEWTRESDVPAGEGIVTPDRIAKQN